MGASRVRPGVDGVDGNEINDTIWQILLMCWKFEPSERPSMFEGLSDYCGDGDHKTKGSTAPKPIIMSDILKSSVVDLERVKTTLMGVLGSEAARRLFGFQSIFATHS